MSKGEVFRIIRGESADYRVHSFTDKGDRDQAADRYAAEDGEDVLCELYDPADGLWWLDRVAYPPGQAPPPLTATEVRQRWTARAICAGDDVTVYAHPVGRFGEGCGADVSGTVATVEAIKLPRTTCEGRRITFTDGRQVDAVDTAVTTIEGT